MTATVKPEALPLDCCPCIAECCGCVCHDVDPRRGA